MILEEPSPYSLGESGKEAIRTLKPITDISYLKGALSERGHQSDTDALDDRDSYEVVGPASKRPRRRAPEELTEGAVRDLAEELDDVAARTVTSLEPPAPAEYVPARGRHVLKKGSARGFATYVVEETPVRREGITWVAIQNVAGGYREEVPAYDLIPGSGPRRRQVPPRRLLDD